MVKERSPDLTIVCKAWPVRNGQHFTKDAFTLNWEQGLIHCPNQVAVPFETGKVAPNPAVVCGQCPLQQQCT